MPSTALWSSLSYGQINSGVSVYRSLFFPLWALCCLLFSLMCSPEGGLCNNNSRHDKREHMQPYRPYTLQRITQLPSTHCLTGWGVGGEWTIPSVGGVVRRFVYGESQAERKRRGDRGRGGRESSDSNCFCRIMMQSTALRLLWQPTGPAATQLTVWRTVWTPTGPSLQHRSDGLL